MSKFDPNSSGRRALEAVPEIVPAETSPVPAEAARGVPELPAPGELAAAPEKRVPAGSVSALEAAETALVETFEVLEDEPAAPAGAKTLVDAAVEDAPSAEKAPVAPVLLEGELADTESDEDGVDVDAEDDVEFGVSAEKTRIERWKARLLDLSLKNRLLNFDSRKALKILGADLGALEDAFATDDDGKVRAFKIFSPPEIKGFAAAEEAGEAEFRAFAARALAAGKIVVEPPPKAGRNIGKTAAERTAAILSTIHKNARKSLEETGTTTLFVALGFLRWKSEKDKKNRTLSAPILLVPATLSLRSGQRAEIRAADEDARVNLTLVELLRQEYRLHSPALEGLLEELPADAAGVDVRRILDVFRDAVKRLGFTVEETCAIANLTFPKYQMWLDLEKRADVLRRSRVVEHLLDDEAKAFETKIPFAKPSALDRELSASDLFCPLSADSSQLAAVRAAAQGKNFILVGPPGTGKSQTIANLVANTLAEGRTVLFVAEKAAALNVVFKRLKDIGLGEFCLELHSEKAARKDVYARFREALELVEKSAAREGASRGADDSEKRRLAVAAEIDGKRLAFRGLFEALHGVRRNGLSFADAVGVVCSREDDPKIELVWKNPADATAGNRRKKQDVAKELGRTFAAAAPVLAGAAGSIGVRGAWKLEEQGAAETSAREFADAARELGALADAFLAAARLADFAGEAPLSRERLRALRGLVAALLAVRGEADAAALVFGADGAKNLAALREAARLVEACATHRGRLSLPYGATATDAPELDALLRLWDESKISWALPRWLKQRKVVRALRVLAGGSEKTPEDPRVDLGNLVALRDKKREFAEKFSALADAFPSLLKKDLSDCGALARLDALDAARAALDAAAEATAPGARGAFRAALEETFRGDAYSSAEKALSDVNAAEEAFAKKRAAFETRFAAPLPEAALVSAESARAFAEETLAAREFWGSVAEWNAAAKRASDNGMAAFVAALLDGSLAADAVERVFETNYCRRWTEAIFDADPVLKNASASAQNELLATFRKADEALRAASAKAVRARLLARARGVFGKDFVGELNAARAEIDAKRHKSLRSFFVKAPRLRFLLKPCMLASPLSVATYLDAEAEPFDLVVFDEASQICAWDAVGALARGRSAVVVGDPKQLPPTSFFARADKAVAAGESVPDAESVLDECRVRGVPAMKLSWHYRSRAESLIAFSNVRYYGGELATFPAPRTRDRALECVFVEKGVYAKSPTNTNLVEARALVERIVADLSRPGFAYDEFSSVGVVTFNERQQTLIEDLLEKAQTERPELRKYFSAEVAEPVFVKNLENVQGDERGVIYFSTTYGPEEERAADCPASVKQNFGPLNQSGGERRLNVAITRARAGMRVFTSMRPDEITSESAGAKDLREFLRFASERRVADAKPAPAADCAKTDAEPTSRERAEDAIAEGLRKRGWKCVRDVGVSDVRVDVAVVDPANPDAFLAGVLCDGAGYRPDDAREGSLSGLSVRDREILREDVLRGLGWNLLRARIADRWLTPNRCLDELDAALNALRRDSTALVVPAPGEKS
ncbi:MAG: DUF4011 domain-containing protein [Candidatus Spyradosoma sp.]